MSTENTQIPKSFYRFLQGSTFTGMIAANTDGSCNGNVQSTSLNTQLVGGSSKIHLICSSCNQEFASTNELNEHMDKHNSEIDEVLMQQHAAAMSTSSVAMTMSTPVNSNIRTRSNILSSFTCMSCGMQFREQNAYLSHQKM